MLHSILLASTSGLVLVHKHFTQNHAKSKHLGGILSALLPFSIAKVGLPVCYIQLQALCVAICTSADSAAAGGAGGTGGGGSGGGGSSSSTPALVCAVFHDVSDGSEFGSLLARQLLAAFSAHLTEHVSRFGAGAGAGLGGGGGGLSLAAGQTGGVFDSEQFGEFQGKIPHIIRDSVKPLLDQLQEQRGISLVLLSSHTPAPSHDAGSASPHELLHYYATQEVDRLAVLANHQALLGVATDIMGAANDSANSVLLRSRRTTLLLLRVERASLVVVFKNSVDAAVCLRQIEKTAEMVRKVLVMASNLKT